MAQTPDDLLNHADHCARLARLIGDTQIREELEALAEQLRDDARRLPDDEREHQA